MYAAHAERKRKEESQEHLKSCLALVESARSDNDRFGALLEVTQHVRANSFTDEDRLAITQAVGLDFLTRLIKTSSVPENCPPSLYKSIALSLLSALTVEPYVVNQPELTDFLAVVKDVLTRQSVPRKSSSPNEKVRDQQMCRDCEEIISHLAGSSSGIHHLVRSGTLHFLVDYSSSPHCEKPVSILVSLGAAVKSLGDGVLECDPGQFHELMRTAVNRLAQSSDLRDKTEHAKILTSFLTGICKVEVTVETDYIVRLTQVLQQLITFKMSPDDSDAVLDLVCALVSAVGPEVLSPEVVGDTSLLKAVVARMLVEVYMMLDNISLDSATERYPKLDKVFKLTCDVVKYVAESGESLDADSMVVVYKKLVEISDTIMEFLCSVANQEVTLPRNHGVVLISVRTVAAILSEITEDPTTKLLELLPFFNLLCQNVEYSDDVIMEVKNATQAALENIKMMGMNFCPHEAELGPHRGAMPESELHGMDKESESLQSSSQTLPSTDCDPSETLGALAHMSLAAQQGDQPSRHSHTSSTSDYSNFNGIDQHQAVPSPSSSSAAAASVNTTDFYIDLQAGTAPTNLNSNFTDSETSAENRHSDILLSQESIDSFKAFQVTVSALSAKPRPFSARKVSFASKNKSKASAKEGTDQSEHWKLTPNDILNFLLPAYAFLLHNEEALEVMTQAETFQTITGFLHTSLTQLLENKSSDYPEDMTLNALSVIEQVYTHSPTTAGRLSCFQDLFEICVLSVPNLLSLERRPPLVCLKLVEVSLKAYRLQMRGNKRNSSLTRLKHSQSRFFKAIVEYLSSVYEFRQHRRGVLSLHIKKEFRIVWPLAEESWCGCVTVLCSFLRSVEELQEVLAKSHTITDFLTFLKDFDAEPDLRSCFEDVKKIIQSMFSLIESAAEGSDFVCQQILHHHGHHIASKFKLRKLERCLKNLPQHFQANCDSD